jgi:zinc-ribbon domain
MSCPKCGATNKEGSNYCHSCGAYLLSPGAEAETSTAEINVPYPEAADLHLRIRVGACRLKITPGDVEAWVSGAYQSPRDALPLKIAKGGGRVTITQDYDVTGLGSLLRYTPRFNLALGRTKAYALTLEAGATDVAANLGGIPLKELTIKQGAGRAEFDFSAPNPQEMASILANSGAVALQMRNLSNANFTEMTFDGGAASYRFDFGGTLRRDAKVRIMTSLAPVAIHMPLATAARVFENTVAAALDLGDGFTKKGGAFLTEAAMSGRTPILTIHANVSLGTLSLRSTE